jgi:hypothetical protein
MCSIAVDAHPPSSRSLSPKCSGAAGHGRSLKLRQLIADLRAQSYLNFDVVMLTIVASIIASFGLATNSVVMVVASMLVSPLMGPLLGLSFGTVIYDWPLTRYSTKPTSADTLLTCFLQTLTRFRNHDANPLCCLWILNWNSICFLPREPWLANI